MVASYNFQTSIYFRILKQKQKLFVLRSYIYIVVYPILLSSMVFPSVRHIVCSRNHILINLIEENCFSYYISVWFEFLFFIWKSNGNVLRSQMRMQYTIVIVYLVKRVNNESLCAFVNSPLQKRKLRTMNIKWICVHFLICVLKMAEDSTQLHVLENRYGKMKRKVCSL